MREEQGKRAHDLNKDDAIIKNISAKEQAAIKLAHERKEKDAMDKKDAVKDAIKGNAKQIAEEKKQIQAAADRKFKLLKSAAWKKMNKV